MIAPSGRADLVVGIPCLSTGGRELPRLIAILQSGLETYYPEINSLIACLISPPELLPAAVMAELSTHEERVVVSQFDKSLAGRGWACRGLMEIARKISADLLIVEPSLLPIEEAASAEGITPDWVRLMYKPIRENEARFVLPRFKTSLLANSTGSHFLYPLLASLYAVELHGCLDAGLAISGDLLPDLLGDLSRNGDQLYEYGFNYWLIARVLEMQAEIAEVYLGVKPKVSLPVGINYLFNQAARTLFDFLGKNQNIWLKTPQALRSALTIGHREEIYTVDLPVDFRPHAAQFRRGYNRYFEAVWSRIFSEEIRSQLAQINKGLSAGHENFVFSANLWAQLVYETFVAYHFISGIEKEDLINGLSTLFEGRLAGYIKEITENHLCPTDKNAAPGAACSLSARATLEAQVDIFIARKSSFKENWIHHKEQLLPFLPEISYWEYIPGVPIFLPHVVKSPDGRRAHVYSFYERLLKEYTDEFSAFIKENLSLIPADGSQKVGLGIRALVAQLEEDLDQILIPGSLQTTGGVKKVAEKIFKLFPTPKSMSLKEEAAARLIRENPPRNLITILGYCDEEELLENRGALDILALAPWSEHNQYSAWNIRWLEKNLTPDDFEISPIIPIVVDYTDFPVLTGMREASTLDHLTSRVVISNLREGSGGSFPKVRFLTTTLKRIIEAEAYGQIWESYIKSCGDDDFSAKVINSIGDHWGAGLFSAHSIFEHLQQIILRDKLMGIARSDWGLSGSPIDKAKDLLTLMAKAYHLGLTLPDGIFITCCLWSWASYSFKGGKAFPTPLSLMIERRWFSGELFMRLYEQVVGSRSEVMPIIVNLMGQNRETEDLAALYLGAAPAYSGIVVEQKIERDLPSAGKLTRSAYNPILAPLADHQWENKYVLNCGTIRIDGGIYIFYRAVGDDGISRLGLAISKNGLQVDKRLPEPVFSPSNESEKMGCEDPRLVAMEGRIYMLYTAYDGVTPQIALASISEEELSAHNWSKWRRHGLVFPGFSNKDAVLFPERFNGKLALYHRIAPSIWIAYADTFDTPWPKEGHKIVMGTRSGMTWDAVKIGAGAQPLKTKYGWLHIYHGVDHAFTYRLGIFITSLSDPSRLLYRSPNPILEPETTYEVGVSGKSWVPNVVFTCGAVATEDKYLLDEDDEILVYYGGADTVIGVATGKLKEIIPERYRRLP